MSTEPNVERFVVVDVEPGQAQRVARHLRAAMTAQDGGEDTNEAAEAYVQMPADALAWCEDHVLIDYDGGIPLAPDTLEPGGIAIAVSEFPPREVLEILKTRAAAFLKERRTKLVGVRLVTKTFTFTSEAA